MKRGLKRKLKKRGSSLVAVLVICSILLVTATTMIGVATSDVRMRINESKKLQNLYKADSGLGIVENIIYKDVEAAIDYALEQVENSEHFNSAIGDLSDSSVYSDINSDFKTIFIKTLLSDIRSVNSDINVTTAWSSTPSITFNSIGESTINVNSWENRLFTSIKNKAYIKEIDNNNIYDINYNINMPNSTETIYKKAIENLDDMNNVDIQITSAEYEALTKKITLEVTSTFKCSDASGSVTKLENTKTIKTKFEIIAPEYAEIINRSSQYNATPIQAPYSNVITADGNLIINENLNVDGNVWIKGDAGKAKNEDPSSVFGKYNGGIILAEDRNLSFAGTIFTASTFSINNNSEFILSPNTANSQSDMNRDYNGNLYANNFYVGPRTTDENNSSSNNITLRKDLITYNDLAINSLSSQITMKNYYGISGVSSTSDSSKENSSKRSGCIIVNNYNINSSLAIEEDAYLNGVAYIDTGSETGGEYETGESIAIKGNYKAYTEVMNGYKDKILLKYYDPYQLIESFKNEEGQLQEATVTDKANYFNEYYAEGGFKTGNITIGRNVYAVGAYVKTGEVGLGQDIRTTSRVSNKQEEYVKLVLGMNSNITEGITDKFENGSVLKSVTGADGSTAVIKFGEIDNNVVSDSVIINRLNDSYTYRYVTNNDDTQEVVIGDDLITLGSDSVRVDNENVKAVIITNGNVKIKSGVKFTGSIIAGGEVIIEDGSENKTELIYDPQVVANIILANNLSNYFNVDGMTVTQQPVNDGDRITTSNNNPDESTSNSYSIGNIVNNGLWKIEK